MMSYIVSLHEVKARGRNVRIAGTSMAGYFIISLKPCEKTSAREYIVNSVPHMRLPLRDYTRASTE